MKKKGVFLSTLLCGTAVVSGMQPDGRQDMQKAEFRQVEIKDFRYNKSDSSSSNASYSNCKSTKDSSMYSSHEDLRNNKEFIAHKDIIKNFCNYFRFMHDNGWGRGVIYQYKQNEQGFFNCTLTLEFEKTSYQCPLGKEVFRLPDFYKSKEEAKGAVCKFALDEIQKRKLYDNNKGSASDDSFEDDEDSYTKLYKYFMNRFVKYEINDLSFEYELDDNKKLNCVAILKNREFDQQFYCKGKNGDRDFRVCREKARNRISRYVLEHLLEEAAEENAVVFNRAVEEGSESDESTDDSSTSSDSSSSVSSSDYKSINEVNDGKENDDDYARLLPNDELSEYLQNETHNKSPDNYSYHKIYYNYSYYAELLWKYMERSHVVYNKDDVNFVCTLDERGNFNPKGSLKDKEFSKNSSYPNKREARGAICKCIHEYLLIEDSILNNLKYEYEKQNDGEGCRCKKVTWGRNSLDNPKKESFFETREKARNEFNEDIIKWLEDIINSFSEQYGINPINSVYVEDIFGKVLERESKLDKENK